MEDFNFTNHNRKIAVNKKANINSLTNSILDLNWNQYLPVSFIKDSNSSTKKFTITTCSFEDGKNFLEDNSQLLFNNLVFNHNFLMLDESQNKDVFCNYCLDNFAFICDDKMVGYASINMQDWNTYYLRYINILPEYRGYKAIVEFMNTIISILLEFGITRIQADIGVHNQSQLTKHLKMGFIVTGNIQSERWGSMVQLTKLLDKKAQSVFLKQYCL